MPAERNEVLEARVVVVMERLGDALQRHGNILSARLHETTGNRVLVYLQS